MLKKIFQNVAERIAVIIKQFIFIFIWTYNKILLAFKYLIALRSLF